MSIVDQVVELLRKELLIYSDPQIGERVRKILIAAFETPLPIAQGKISFLDHEVQSLREAAMMAALYGDTSPEVVPAPPPEVPHAD